MNNIAVLNSILSDISNFVLVIFGFTVTLFTVLYSFILNKREILRECSERIKKGDKNPLLYQKSSNSKNTIVRLKKLNIHLIIIIISSLMIYLISILSKYVISDFIKKKIILIIVFIFSILLVSYVSLMLFLTIKDYLRNTKL